MDLSFCSNTQSEAVTSVHGEISQKSMSKWENVGDVHSPLPDGWPNRRVSFCKPGDKCSIVEGENPSVEPSISNLEAWLEYQSTQIGTPMWWKELEAVLGITNRQKFARKIQVHHFIYRRCGPGCSQEKGILHLLPPKVWIEGPTSQITLLTRM